MTWNFCSLSSLLFLFLDVSTYSNVVRVFVSVCVCLDASQCAQCSAQHVCLLHRNTHNNAYIYSCVYKYSLSPSRVIVTWHHFISQQILIPVNDGEICPFKRRNKNSDVFFFSTEICCLDESTFKKLHRSSELLVDRGKNINGQLNIFHITIWLTITVTCCW